MFVQPGPGDAATGGADGAGDGYVVDVYLPRAFVEPDTGAAVEMVRAARVGHLTVAAPDGLVSTPMPLLIDDAGSTLRGHLARQNPLIAAAPADALVIVPVGDAYVSPSWYPSKVEHGKVVPTWNYEVVHVRGRLTTHSRDWTLQLVRDLTDHHETSMERPWSVDDAPADYVDRLLGAIVGVSVEVTEIVAKRKLSQNKSGDDLDGAIAGLRETGRPGDGEIADAMDRHRPRG